MPKRSCLFFGHNGRGQLGWKPSESLKGRRQEGRVNAIREEPGYIYTTTRTRYVETQNNRNGRFWKTKTYPKIHCTKIWHDGFCWYSEDGALTLFSSTRPLESNGESFGSDTLSDWAKGFSVKLIGLMLPIQTFAFPFTWFQTASCLQLLPKCPNGWDEELATQGG